MAYFRAHCAASVRVIEERDCKDEERSIISTYVDGQCNHGERTSVRYNCTFIDSVPVVTEEVFADPSCQFSKRVLVNGFNSTSCNFDGVNSLNFKCTEAENVVTIEEYDDADCKIGKSSMIRRQDECLGTGGKVNNDDALLSTFSCDVMQTEVLWQQFSYAKSGKACDKAMLRDTILLDTERCVPYETDSVDTAPFSSANDVTSPVSHSYSPEGMFAIGALFLLILGLLHLLFSYVKTRQSSSKKGNKII